MAQATNQEIEAKFVILDPKRATYLRNTPSLTRGFTLQTAKTVSNIDTYIDTAAYRLLRSGYTLRVRQTANGYQATLKGLPLDDQGHIHRRVELEAPLQATATPFDLAYWPNQIREFVTGVAGADLELHPLCTLRQTRQKRLVAVKIPRAKMPAEPFAELSIDQVSVFLPDNQTASALPVIDEQAEGIITFWEAEAELLDGQDEAQLEKLADQLKRTHSLRPNPHSKLERALEAISSRLVVGETVFTEPQPALHTADACRLIWQRQLLRMVINEAGVRHSSDIEYVHDMRVAVRRARVAMQLFEPYFRRKPLRGFRRLLRDTGRKLGTVRDLDVALDKLTKQPAQGDIPNDFAGLIAHWQQQRTDAFAKLLAWLDSEEYTDFLTDFTQFCRKAGKGAQRQNPAGEPPIPLELRHVLPSMLIERFEGVRVYETLFAGEQAPPTATLHQLRIACKFLRYNLEFTQHLLGMPGARLIRNLKALQEHLGDLNDAAVSAEMLAAVPAEVTNTALQSYLQTQHTLVEELSAKLPPDLLAFIAPANRRLLLQALVQI